MKIQTRLKLMSYLTGAIFIVSALLAVHLAMSMHTIYPDNLDYAFKIMFVIFVGLTLAEILSNYYCPFVWLGNHPEKLSAWEKHRLGRAYFKWRANLYPMMPQHLLKKLYGDEEYPLFMGTECHPKYGISSSTRAIVQSKGYKEACKELQKAMELQRELDKLNRSLK